MEKEKLLSEFFPNLNLDNLPFKQSIAQVMVRSLDGNVSKKEKAQLFFSLTSSAGNWTHCSGMRDGEVKKRRSSKK